MALDTAKMSGNFGGGAGGMEEQWGGVTACARRGHDSHKRGVGESIERERERGRERGREWDDAVLLHVYAAAAAINHSFTTVYSSLEAIANYILINIQSLLYVYIKLRMIMRMDHGATFGKR